MSPLTIAGRTFTSRLFLGTGKFGSTETMAAAIRASGTELVTVAIQRIELGDPADDLATQARQPGVALLPNTSGVRTAREALVVARLAREALGTDWVKLEIHPDPRYLMPDPLETVEATKRLVDDGFVVLPYCGADPVLCKRLEEAGAAAVMPLGSPIGSSAGLKTEEMLRIIVEMSAVPVVVDAGLGVPSHAAAAMEIGADAVLVNTAIAIASDPSRMATAFKMAVEAGRAAFETGIPERSTAAEATSPLTTFLYEAPGDAGTSAEADPASRLRR